MKEELLIELKLKLEEVKRRNSEHNNKVRRIKELERNSSVKEYLKLLEIQNSNFRMINKSDREIIEDFYYGYLYRIKENDTNGIYVYLGTYSYSSEIDIVHGSNDIRVSYDSLNADYRVYCDIEQSICKNIHISKCQEFEKKHIVINPDSYYKRKIFYEIQREFFVSCIKASQESAKKRILKKYPRLSKNCN